MSVPGVRRDKVALSSGCKAHPANAPAGSSRSSYGGDEIAEAFGMRVTNWGQQAVTQVNAEQASKRTMRRPTRQPFRGRLIRLGGSRAKSTPSRCAGVVATACTQGKRTQHGKPHGVVSKDQPEARQGRGGRPGV